MFRSILMASAICLATSGIVFAQTDGSGSSATDNATGAAKAPGMLDDPVAMKPFYTDESMMTMRSMDEMRAAAKAMNENDKAKIMEECKNVNTQRSSFCKAFNDANQM